jgi:hypothetical protein
MNTRVGTGYPGRGLRPAALRAACRVILHGAAGCSAANDGIDMAAERPAYVDRRIELFEQFSKE